MVQLSGTNSTSRLTKMLFLLFCCVFSLKFKMTIEWLSHIRLNYNENRMVQLFGTILTSVYQPLEKEKRCFAPVSCKYLNSTSAVVIKHGKASSPAGLFNTIRLLYRVVLKAREILWFFLHKLAQLELWNHSMFYFQRLLGEKLQKEHKWVECY